MENKPDEIGEKLRKAIDAQDEANKALFRILQNTNQGLKDWIAKEKQNETKI